MRNYVEDVRHINHAAEGSRVGSSCPLLCLCLSVYYLIILPFFEQCQLGLHL